MPRPRESRVRPSSRPPAPSVGRRLVVDLINIVTPHNTITEAYVMDRHRALQLAMAVLMLGLIGAGAKAADQKMVFKASDVHPEGYPTVQAVENMGKKLEAATGGQLSIQMYASMQLGGEKEAIEQAQV